MCEGHQENLKCQAIQQESIALWQAAAIAGMTWNKEFDIKAFWEARQNSKNPDYKPVNDEEELYKRTKETGLLIPPEWEGRFGDGNQSMG
jgi:hypothetical protein